MKYNTAMGWRWKRRIVIERAHGICEQCHERKIQHIHHLTYVRCGNELLEDLQGLCLVCHQIAHPHHNFRSDSKLQVKRQSIGCWNDRKTHWTEGPLGCEIERK